MTARFRLPDHLRARLRRGISSTDLELLMSGAGQAMSEHEAAEIARQVRTEKLRRIVRRFGLSRLAGRLKLDRSNLPRLLMKWPPRRCSVAHCVGQ